MQNLLRYCCCFLFLIFLSCHLNGQGFQIGYYIKPQISSIESSATSDFQSNVNPNQTITLNTGVTATYYFSPKLAATTGITYAHEGQKFIYEKYLGSPNVYDRSAHHYVFSVLKLPLMLRFQGAVKKVRFIVEGGPQLCYIAQVVDKTNLGSVDLTNDYSAFSVGFQIGTGIGYMATEKIMIYFKPEVEVTGYTYHYTFSNLNTEYPLGHNLVANNMGLQVGLTYRLK